MATAFSDIQPDHYEPEQQHPQNGVIIGGPAARAKRLEYGILLATMTLGSIGALYWVLTHPTGWVEWSAFLFGFALINMGVGIGYHRYFTHRSFEAGPKMRLAIGIMAQMATQASVLKWAADHRRHHAFSDHVGDLHSPHIDGHGKPMSKWKGLAVAHFGWLFDNTTSDMNVYGKGLIDDPQVLWCHKYRWHIAIFSVFIMPALWALAFGGPEHIIGTILIGGLFRNFFFLNFVMGVNSLNHVFGSRRFDTKDDSRNQWFMAWMTFGDGWHNNHHMHPRAASSQIAWWEFDLNGQIIYLWEKMGLVWNVQRAPKYTRDKDGNWIQEKTLTVDASPEEMSTDDGGVMFPETSDSNSAKSEETVQAA